MSEARDSTTFDVTLSLRAPCSSADTGLPWFSLTTLSLSEFGVSAPEFYGVAGVVNPVTSRGTGLSVGDLFFFAIFRSIRYYFFTWCPVFNLRYNIDK